MNWFISGGCKNGKSHYAQNIAWDMAGKPSGAAVTSGAAAEKPLYYLATMIPRDERTRRASPVTSENGQEWVLKPLKEALT